MYMYSCNPDAFFTEASRETNAVSGLYNLKLKNPQLLRCRLCHSRPLQKKEKNRASSLSILPLLLYRVQRENCQVSVRASSIGPLVSQQSSRL